MERGKLPESWRKVCLGDIVQKSEKRDPRKTPEDKFLYVDISSINRDLGVVEAPSTFVGKEAPSRARKVIRTNDVVFATTRPYLKNIAMIPTNLDNQICSTGFCVLRPLKELALPQWIFYLCRSDLVLNQIISNMRGASYPAVSDKDVLSVEITLPPLDEQLCIVARIEELTERVDEARRLRAEAIEQVDTIVESAIKDVWSNQRDWTIKPIGEIATLVSGQVDPRIEPYASLPHINGEVIESGTCRLLSYRLAKEDGLKSGKYHFKAGSVLYSKIRPYLKKAVQVPFEGICSADVYAFETINSELESRFFMYSLVSPGFTEYANSLSGRTRIPKLNRKDLLPFQMGYPPLTEQRRIVEYLDGIQDKVEQLRGLQEKTQAELDTFSQAILVKAFRGEL